MGSRSCCESSLIVFRALATSASLARAASNDSVPSVGATKRRGRVRNLRVRLHIIRNEILENVCKTQSCMVSKLRIICKQTVVDVCLIQVGSDGQCIYGASLDRTTELLEWSADGDSWRVRCRARCVSFDSHRFALT